MILMNYLMKYQKKNYENIKFISKILFVTLLLFVCQIGFSQFKIPPVPDFQTSVYDYANLLSSTEKAQLEEN